ncbi:uncharacterized protein DUF4239 [Saccharopolyspora erythraea NRRL 2338]|uniref:Uncharacterized protein n=2 Tax=Saccharopolyspora erythraea TaxID=1836 RepID=A4FGS0_SACEN|nr:DUF4239 domain-containing protein [Saccharopolyspora erythraea]EQD85600.1 hypothetical protein N599_13955 [Saccharopolyspora erythraea D]PFG96949.1 uncharacterized protein DUF4239 [Saccharopolyspora erythraea NRRL 2338]QRK87169.1 DUF4239 domain-containing protein [Saccharopolyspora erythraea]CAM03245.1 hypothetical protein SACE_3974 [Saccharopolyspora erythraea NRRL 2338]
MSVYVSGSLWVAGAVLVAAAVAYMVRRFGQDEGRPGNNDAAGQVFTIVSGLHAVVVAFVLITLFDTVGSARDGAYEEAESLVAVSWAADSLPGPAGAEVRALGKQYADTVVRQEWPQMRAGADVTGPGWTQLDLLRDAVLRAEADGDWQEGRKSEATTRLEQVYEQRQERLNTAFDSGVVAVVWFVLIAGSVICVLLPNLFGGTRMFTHIIVVSTLAGVLTLLLFAIYQLQNPFGGGSWIEPDAFRWALARLG